MADTSTNLDATQAKIDSLRAKREALADQIDDLRGQQRELTDQINELEGPVYQGLVRAQNAAMREAAGGGEEIILKPNG